MAFAEQIQGVETGIVRRMREALLRARTQHAKKREFNRTYAELNALSERELDDLGISRGSIADIARSATIGK